jgi:hypothetical protein
VITFTICAVIAGIALSLEYSEIRGTLTMLSQNYDFTNKYYLDKVSIVADPPLESHSYSSYHDYVYGVNSVGYTPECSTMAEDFERAASNAYGVRWVPIASSLLNALLALLILLSGARPLFFGIIQIVICFLSVIAAMSPVSEWSSACPSADVVEDCYTSIMMFRASITYYNFYAAQGLLSFVALTTLIASIFAIADYRRARFFYLYSRLQQHPPMGGAAMPPMMYYQGQAAPPSAPPHYGAGGEYPQQYPPQYHQQPAQQVPQQQYYYQQGPPPSQPQPQPQPQHVQYA